MIWLQPESAICTGTQDVLVQRVKDLYTPNLMLASDGFRRSETLGAVFCAPNGLLSLMQ